MIKRFKEVAGDYIEKIIGQDRFAFSVSDTIDFYDMIELSKAGGYQGAVIKFFDFESGDVYKPFEKKRNVVYSKPFYINGFFYFLQGDYSEKRINLYRYMPGKILEKETELNTEEVRLFNLRIIGNPIHIISSIEDSFECYYPERISFEINGREAVIFAEDGKIYFEEWVEEGLYDEKGCPTDSYKYYHKVKVKDYSGNTLSEEVGGLYQAADGTWWLA